MKSKNDQVMIGIIILLLGVFVTFSGNIRFDISNLLFFAAGFGFLLLYKTKKKSWSLVVGGYLLSFGLAMLISDVLPVSDFSERLTLYLSSSFAFLVTGIMLMALFNDKNKKGLLLPGMIFIGIGISNFADNVLLWKEDYISFFIYSVCMYVVSKMGSYFVGRVPGIASVVLFAVAVFKALSAYS